MEENSRISREQWTLVGLMAALALGVIGYKLLVLHRLEQTSALFIGLPTIIAMVLVLTPKAKSATGMIMKVMVISLLMSGPVLQEGFICILMASPLFLLVGLVIGIIVDRRKRNLRVLAPIPFLLMALEGVDPRTSFCRDEEVVITRRIPVSANAIRRSIARGPALDGPLPFFLRLGFPHPDRVAGNGLEPGSPRVIHFAGGEGKPGDLRFEVAASTPDGVRFRALDDKSHIAHWLVWQETAFGWREVAPSQSDVVLKLRYRRLLDPAWYFGPTERYAVQLAGETLIADLVRHSGDSPK